MKRYVEVFSVAFVCLFASASSADDVGDSAGERLELVATIQPIHSLVAGVVGERGRTTLLLGADVSPHDSWLKPSQMKSINRADAVFYVARGFENFVGKALRETPKSVRVVELAKLEGLKIHVLRSGGLWGDHAHHHHGHGASDEEEHHGHEGEEGADDHHDDHADGHHGREDDHDDHAGHDDHEDHAGHDDHEDHAGHDDHEDHAGRDDHEDHAGRDDVHHGREDDHGDGKASAMHDESGVVDERDYHLWLDIGNAKAFVVAIADVLEEISPDDGAYYQANAARLIEDLDALDKELRKTIGQVPDAAYLVFHDAYQYLERRYGLNAVGAVSVSPELVPSPKRIKELRERIEETGARCLFAEPQFPDQVVKLLAGDSGVKTGVLDPLGRGIEAGRGHYFALMRQLAASIRDCLK